MSGRAGRGRVGVADLLPVADPAHDGEGVPRRRVEIDEGTRRAVPQRSTIVHAAALGRRVGREGRGLPTGRREVGGAGGGPGPENRAPRRVVRAHLLTAPGGIGGRGISADWCEVNRVVRGGRRGGVRQRRPNHQVVNLPRLERRARLWPALEYMLAPPGETISAKDTRGKLNRVGRERRVDCRSSDELRRR